MTFKSQLVRNVPAFHRSGFMEWTSTVDNGQYLYNLSAIPQGDALGNRTGDKVYFEALHLNFHIETETAANYYFYRIIVYSTREEYTSTTSTYLGGNVTTAGTPMGDMILGNMGNHPGTNITNSKSCTKHYDMVLDLNSAISGVRTGKCFGITVPLKKDFIYDLGSNYGKYSNLYALIVPSVSGGTAGVTTCGYVLGTFDLIFKNI